LPSPTLEHRPRTPERLRSLVVHTGLNFASMGLLSAIMLVTSILASRALGRSDRGVLALLLLVPVVLHLLLDLGLEQGLTVKVANGSLASPDRRAVFRGLAGHTLASAAVAGAVAAAAPLAGGSLAALGGRNGPLTVAACALAVLQRDLTGLLYGHQKIPAVSAARVAGGMLAAGGTAVLWWLGRSSVTEYFAMYVLGTAAVAAALALQVRALLPARPGPGGAVDWRLVSSTGLPWYGASLTYFAVSRFDSFLLGATRPPAELGLYSNAVNLSEVIWYFPGALGQVLLPHTGARGDARLCRRTLVVVVAISLLSALALGLAGQLLISLLFGPAFAAALRPFLLLLPGAVGISCVRIGEIWLLIYGRAKVVRAINTAAAAAGGALWWVTVPRYGMQAAALVSSVLYCSMGAASLAMVRRTVRAQPGEAPA
jgi:O-antigen/teichoic acid export membrane protein